MLLRGTRKRTREQIQDELDRLKTQLRVFGGATGATVTLETTRDQFADSMRLAAEILREPSFPAAEMEQLRQERLAGLEDSKNEPQQKAFTTLAKHLNPWPKSDPRYPSSPEEDIESTTAVSLAEAKQFWDDFYGAGAAEIAVVGDVDPAATRKLVEELFAGFKNRKGFTRLVDTYQDRPVLRQSVETPDKESAVFAAGLRIPMRDDSADYPAMVLGNFMTGGGFLNSRLAVRIRQKEGLSYGVRSSFNASAFDSDAQFGSFAIYAPQNSERLVAAYQEEIAKIVEKGFTDEEIAEAKKGWLQGATSPGRPIASWLGPSPAVSSSPLVHVRRDPRRTDRVVDQRADPRGGPEVPRPGEDLVRPGGRLREGEGVGRRPPAGGGK